MIDENTKITCYDPSTNIFTALTHDTHEIEDMERSTATMVGKKIYIIRGSYTVIEERDDYDVNDMDVFDIDTKKWSQTPSFYGPFYDVGVTVINRWIVVTGGKDMVECDFGMDNPNTPCLDIFDTHTQKTIDGHFSCHLPEPRSMHQCVKVGSQIVVVGGFCDRMEENYCPVAAIDIKHIIPDWKWKTIKHYVLLRKLLDDKRSTPIITTKKRKRDSNDDDVDDDDDIVVQKLFTDISLDVFRHIMTYLI